MGFRFWRRKKLAPGVTFNLSKSGGSLSFGPRGAKFTVSPRGRRSTVGIPGSGLFYTSTGSGGGSSQRSEAPAADGLAVPPEQRLSMGFFKRLITPQEEEDMVDGCRELVAGDTNAALAHLRKATGLPDAAYLAGLLSVDAEQYAEAETYLATAARNHRRLGRLLDKYGMAAMTTLQITEQVAAHVEPGLRGCLLALAEVYQRQERWKDAVRCLERLQQLEPNDVVVTLSLAELLCEARPEDRETARQIVSMTAALENETPIHTALLLYKAKALRALGLLDAARDALTYALRRKKDRSAELRRALRYERACIYEESGRSSRARSEFEKLFAQAPDYEDVAGRLGLEES
ncbi:MAG: DUF4236 domain-containing protein [bacterium]